MVTLQREPLTGIILDTPTTTGLASMATYLTEAADTLDYHNHQHAAGYADYANNKTIDLIGEEFIKKEDSRTRLVVVTSSPAAQQDQQSASLPSLTYTTTTIPTISSSQDEPEAASGGGGGAAGNGGGGGVLYYNLDDLSRYMPENFSFDENQVILSSAEAAGSIAATSASSGLDVEDINNKMMISIPGDKGSQSFSIQVKENYIVLKGSPILA